VLFLLADCCCAAACSAPCLYIWVAVRQLEGLYKNCWLVEYVTPVRDPEIVKVLQLGY